MRHGCIYDLTRSQPRVELEEQSKIGANSDTKKRLSSERVQFRNINKTTNTSEARDPDR